MAMKSHCAWCEPLKDGELKTSGICRKHQLLVFHDARMATPDQYEELWGILEPRAMVAGHVANVLTAAGLVFVLLYLGAHTTLWAAKGFPAAPHEPSRQPAALALPGERPTEKNTGPGRAADIASLSTPQEPGWPIWEGAK